MAKMPKSDKVFKVKARLSFARLFYPKAFEEGQKERFEATFLIDPSDADQVATFKEIHKEALKLAKEAFGPETTLKNLKGVCFGKGDDLPTVYEGYEGMLYVRTASTVRPAIANRRGEPVAKGDEQEPYAGCYVLGSLSLWVQNHPKGGKRVNGNLRGVQFVRDGEAFGQAPISAESEFEALDDNTPADDGLDDDLDDFDI